MFHLNLFSNGQSPWTLTLAMRDPAAALRGADPAAARLLMTAALCHQMDALAPGAVERFLARLTNELVFGEAVRALLADLETPARLHARRDSVQPGEIRRL